MNELLLDDADRREAVTGSRENATKEINANLNQSHNFALF